MNETVNKYLLTGDKFLPEILLKQPGFTYSACGLFTKNKEKIQKFMLTGNTNYHGYQSGLVSMVYRFFDKSSKVSAAKSMSNQKLSDKLHKSITREF